MTQALPWIKAWTRVLTSPRWLALPIEERGVFDHLCRLAGVGGVRGLIEGTDAEIASLIRVTPELVTKTIDKLSGKPYESLRRRRGGVLITNWADYQAPSNYDPDVQSARGSLGGRPRKPTVSDDRKPMVSQPRNPTREGEREEEKEGEGDTAVLAVLAELAQVRGYPYEFDLDVIYIAKLMNDLPTVNLIEVVRDFGAAAIGQQNPAKWASRIRLRNWCKKALEFQARDRARLSVVAPVPPVEEQLAAKKAARQ